MNSLALAKAAEAGLGITVLPESLVSEALSAKRLRFVRLDTAGIENQMPALLHRNQYITKPLRLLLDMLKKPVTAGLI